MIHLVGGLTGAGRTTYALALGNRPGDLQRIDQRRRVPARVAAADMSVRLHFLDVDTEERRTCVERCNVQHGETFRSDVTRAMFDFIETIRQPPSADAMTALNGMRVTA